MSIFIAFCTDAKVFLRNEIFDPHIAQQYPGALWLSELKKKLSNKKIELVTGDIALEKINEGKVSPSNILVLQEESSKHGSKLIALGAMPFLILCAESPMYAGNFYKALPRLSKDFTHRILFRGIISNKKNNDHVLYFPSFKNYTNLNLKKWHERKFSVFVASNKYWKINIRTFRNFLSYLKYFINNNIHFPSYSYIKKNQLLDKRLCLIEYFAKEGLLDLYGSGWTNLGNLSSSWEKRLTSIVKKLKPAICEDKVSTISGYKFSFCVENIKYPGYITEKIIDSLVAGVIPVYLGAPDIEEFIPTEIFIDARKYENIEELKNYLLEIKENQANRMIDLGQKFLRSKQGNLYSYEEFADRISDLLEEKLSR
jgi:hypothetical protein